MLVSSGLTTILWLLHTCLLVSGKENHRLTAVSTKVHLKHRDQGFEPKFQEQTVHYLDELNIGSSAEPLAASITFEPKLPALILEDIQEHVTSLTCSETQMVIQFHSDLTASAAIALWTRFPELLFVTSQQTCAEEGAHSPYIVSRPSLDAFGYAVVFKAKKTTLKSSCHKLFVDVGDHVLAQIDHEALRRRSAKPQPQGSSELPTAPTSSNIQIAPTSLTVSFEYPTPTFASNSSKISHNSHFSYIDTTLMPPDGTIASYLATVIPPPEDVTLKCLNCTMSSSLSFEAAGFSITTDPSLNDKANAIMDFFDTGYLQFSASDMFANMSFELAFLPGFTIPIFEARLPDIPLGAIVIQEVLTFGPVLQFLFPIAVTLNSPVTFQTGFVLDVPPNSSIILNVSDITSSSSKGFREANLTVLPFNANSENLSLNFSVGFQPKIVLGAALFEDVSSNSGMSNDSSDSLLFQANGGVGAYLDLPQLVATVSQVNNTDDRCEASSASADNGQVHVHIEPHANFAAGVEWNLDVHALGVGFGRGGGQVMYETSNLLPTQCLKWNSDTASFTSAAPTESSNTATDTSSATVLKNSWLSMAFLLSTSLVIF